MARAHQCDHRTLEKLQPSAKNKDRRRTFHFRQQGWISILSLDQISCPQRTYPLYFTLDIGKAGEDGSASATPCLHLRYSLLREIDRVHIRTTVTHATLALRLLL